MRGFDPRVPVLISHTSLHRPARDKPGHDKGASSKKSVDGGVKPGLGGSAFGTAPVLRSSASRGLRAASRPGHEGGTFKTGEGPNALAPDPSFLEASAGL